MKSTSAIRTYSEVEQLHIYLEKARRAADETKHWNSLADKIKGKRAASGGHTTPLGFHFEGGIKETTTRKQVQGGPSSPTRKNTPKAPKEGGASKSLSDTPNKIQPLVNPMLVIPPLNSVAAIPLGASSPIPPARDMSPDHSTDLLAKHCPSPIEGNLTTNCSTIPQEIQEQLWRFERELGQLKQARSSAKRKWIETESVCPSVSKISKRSRSFHHGPRAFWGSKSLKHAAHM